MRRLFSTFREAAFRFSRDGCAFLAQALAFNALFALFPLVILILTGASFIFPLPEHRLLTFFGTLSPTLRDYVEGNLRSYIYGRGISSIIAFVFLVWSAKNLFMGLAYALDRTLDVPKGRPLVHHIALSIVMLPITGLLFFVAMLLPVVLAIVAVLAGLADARHIVQIAAYAISLALVFVVSVTLYAFLPNRKLPWNFGIPGAMFAACVWPLMQFVFSQYTLHVDFTHIYGALSAPLVLLLWFYLVSSVFLFGAELCATWAAHRAGSRVLKATAR